MNTFEIFSIDSAPAQSRPVLEALKQSFGFVPNIAGAMSGSPTLINGFIGLFQRVHAGTFNEAEIQTVLLTDAVTNRSTWATAFHTALALKHDVDPSDVTAIREGRLPKQPRLAALSGLAKNLIEKRGHAESRILETFYAAGFQTEHVLEAIAIVAASAITNYVGNLAQPPLEDAFKSHQWAAPAL